MSRSETYWLHAPLAWMHRTYLSAMGGATHAASHAPRAPATAAARSEASRLANEMGAMYRGMGVLIGLLSIAILALAVTPAAFPDMALVTLEVLKAIKVALMALVVVSMLAVLRIGRWRQRWVEARSRAQRERYATLRLHVEAFAAARHDHAADLEERTDALRQECLRLLEGQVDYNQVTAHRYHAVEARTMRLTYVLFGVSLLAAAVDVGLVHYHVKFKPMIYLTALLPAAVGVLHGLNSFLGIGEQAFSCQLMARHLAQLKTQLEASDGDAEATLLLAREALRLLEGHDVLWAPSVKTFSV